MAWIDGGKYWISTHEQRSPGWFEARAYRVTGSVLGTAAGHSRFDTPENLADQIAEISEKQFTETQIENMAYGTKYEPLARKYYEQTYKITVTELGVCVPKWNSMLGFSPDGIVGEDGMIEIKCPKKMYQPLLKSHSRTEIPNHIWRTHYDQMIGGMAILGRKYCDYIVFCPEEKQVYVERVPFNQKYWETELYPAIQKFISKFLLPRLAGKTVSLPEGWDGKS